MEKLYYSFQCRSIKPVTVMPVLDLNCETFSEPLQCLGLTQINQLKKKKLGAALPIAISVPIPPEKWIPV